MEYFYTPPHLVGPDDLVIEGDEFSHLTHVMRRATGDALMVVDGAGNAYSCVIAGIERRTARCTIRKKEPRLHEPDVAVMLGAAILKNSSRFDLLVEKSTELGVDRIVPLSTERTIPRHAKTDRWQKLALAAMKQSGRCILPRIHPLTPFPDFLQSAPRDAVRLIPYEHSHDPFPILPGSTRSVVICIGPEGGFTEEEVQRATRAGFRQVSLGALRLRTETAAIVAVAKSLGL